MEQFRLVNAQQQPFIRSGYNAMGRLNTLLGLGGRPMAAPQMGSVGNHMYRPTPGGGMQQMAAVGPSSPKSNPRLAQLLMMRAQNGDTEAARIMQEMQ